MSKKQKQKVGRTYFTNDKFLPHSDNNAYKNVNIVSIEYDKQGNMIGVRLTGQKTSNTSSLNHHTYKGFKHFIEIEDIDGNPIKKGERFKENSKYFDLTPKQVEYISDVIYNHSKQSQRNRKMRDEFHNRDFKHKKSRD